MKVYEAEDGMVMEKNCVYVIPNRKLITVKGNALKLLEKPIPK
jgi:two-component system CheB/CheR fusion protein